MIFYAIFIKKIYLYKKNIKMTHLRKIFKHNLLILRYDWIYLKYIIF